MNTSSPRPPAHQTIWPLPLWIAHRGAGKLAPENTLAAFRLGAQHGYRAYECDLKLSADGVPFLLHDDDLARTCDVEGLAGESTWAELSRLDAGSWHSRRYAGEPPASLEAIARFILANGHALNIELKPNPGQALETGRVMGHEVRRLWGSKGQPSPMSLPLPPLFSSFEPDALVGVRETAPEYPRALLLDEHRDNWLNEALQLGCVGVITNHRLMDEARIEAIHAAGLKAAVYTVNDVERAQALLRLGIDSIITDAVDRFSPA